MELEQMSSAELIELVKLQEAALKAEQARYESLAQAFPVARESQGGGELPQDER